MPKTTPTWITICCEAPAIPRSASSTDTVTLVASGGMAIPMPTPARASAPMIISTDEPVPRVAIHARASVTHAAPPAAARRDPSRMTTRPAAGPAIENASGRAMLTRPVLVAEHVLKQQRREDERPHVRGVDECLGTDRVAESGRAHVPQRQERMGGTTFDPDERV